MPDEKEKKALLVKGNTPQPIIPVDYDTAWRMSKAISMSGLAPKDYKGSPEAVFAAIQLGSETGLTPMQAVQNIAVINGRASIWGDAMLALVRGSGELEYIKETYVGEWLGREKTDATFKAVCTVKRKGSDERVEEYTIQDAMDAELWHRDIWKKNAKRMLRMRARAFALRDEFTDILKGLYAREEAEDITPVPMVDVTPGDDKNLSPEGQKLKDIIAQEREIQDAEVTEELTDDAENEKGEDKGTTQATTEDDDKKELHTGKGVSQPCVQGSADVGEGGEGGTGEDLQRSDGSDSNRTDNGTEPDTSSDVDVTHSEASDEGVQSYEEWDGKTVTLGDNAIQKNFKSCESAGKFLLMCMKNANEDHERLAMWNSNQELINEMKRFCHDELVKELDEWGHKEDGAENN